MLGSPGPPRLRLRQASRLDAAWLAAFTEATFRASYAHLMTPEHLAEYCRAAFGLAQQTEELSWPHSRVLVAELDERPLGFAWLVRRALEELPACVTSTTALQLARLYVDPAVQSQGLGRALVDGARSAASELGGTSLWLSVWTRNPRAIAFYRRQGFTEVGRTGFPGDPDPACDLVLTRDLAG